MSDVVDDQTEADQPEPDPIERSADTSPTDGSTGHADSAEPDTAELGEIDVVGIEADLDGVQAALTRLAEGTYWTDEVTGEPIPAAVLDADPLSRRA